MQIQQYVWDVVDSNSWLITEHNHGLLIDAVDNPELMEAIKPLESLIIILTHCHFDHICGLNRIREIRPDAKVIATTLCSEYIGNKYRNMSSSADAFLAFYQQGNKRNIHIDPFICAPIDCAINTNEQFDWQGHKVKMYLVYGHSDDGLLCLFDDVYLFSGDTLLSIPTITRLPRGTNQLFWDYDIPLIKQMNPMSVFPGHSTQGEVTEMINANNIKGEKV